MQISSVLDNATTCVSALLDIVLDKWRIDGIEYDATVDRSDAYLRKHVHEKQSMVVLYVDLVGSTDITLTLPEEKIAIIDWFWSSVSRLIVTPAEPALTSVLNLSWITSTIFTLIEDISSTNSFNAPGLSFDLICINWT